MGLFQQQQQQQQNNNKECVSHTQAAPDQASCCDTPCDCTVQSQILSSLAKQFCRPRRV